VEGDPREREWVEEVRSVNEGRFAGEGESCEGIFAVFDAPLYLKQGADALAQRIGWHSCLLQAMRKKKTEMRLPGRVSVWLAVADQTGITQITEADRLTAVSEVIGLSDIVRSQFVDGVQRLLL